MPPRPATILLRSLTSKVDKRCRTLNFHRSLLHNMPVSTTRAPDITADVGGQANVELLERISRDFRSDTLTVPSDGQILAGLMASRGDDVYKEDSETEALQNRVAKLCGKEAALFVVSGTMSNQLAIRTHMVNPPHSVITDHRAHVHKMEAGGIAMFSQATTHSLVPENGIHLTLEDDILPNLTLGEDIHTAPTRLVCLENTLSGMIFPQDEIVKIKEELVKHNIPLHCDGARIWNVAAAECAKRGIQGEEALQDVLTELAAPFDTMSLCLSKGIGAPVGSVLVGPKAFIHKVNHFRKMFGGGIRQSGALAAAANYALTHHFPRLDSTHQLAKRLGEGLSQLGCRILAPVDTSMVFFDPKPIHVPMEAIIARCDALERPICIRGSRLVLHHQTSPRAVEDLLAVVAELKSEVNQGDIAKLAAEGKNAKVDKIGGAGRERVQLGY